MAQYQFQDAAAARLTCNASFFNSPSSLITYEKQTRYSSMVPLFSFPSMILNG